MRRSSRLLLAVVASVAFAPNAHAGWSEPATLSSPSTFASAPWVGFDGAGRAFASWHWQQGTSPGSGGARSATRARDGAWSTERDVPRWDLDPLLYGRDRVVLVRTLTRRSGGAAVAQIRVAFGRTGGPFGRARTVASYQPALPRVAAAANARGDIAIAYLEQAGGARRVAVVRRRSGGPFRTHRRLTRRGRASAVGVAVGPRGEILVAWERDGRVEARRTTGDGWGSQQRLGPAPARAHLRIRTAVSGRGTPWVAWGGQALDEGGGNGPFELHVAVGSARGFGAAHRLDAFSGRLPQGARWDMQLDPRGRALLGWTSWDGRRWRARMAFGGPRSLRDEGFVSDESYDALVNDVATAAVPGLGIVVWGRLDAVGELATEVRAAVRKPFGGTHGDERVSRGDRAREPWAAFDPRDHRPLVVWSQRQGPDGPEVPIDQVRTYIRAAERIP